MEEMIEQLKKEFPDEEEINILGVYMIIKLQSIIPNYQESNLSRLNNWKRFNSSAKWQTFSAFLIMFKEEREEFLKKCPKMEGDY